MPVLTMNADVSAYLQQPLRRLKEALYHREEALATSSLHPLHERDRRRPPGVLIIEDEAAVGIELAAIVAGLGCAALGPVSSGEAAVVIAGRQRPELILMDVGLEGRTNGIEAATAIVTERPVPIIFVTGQVGLFEAADLDIGTRTAVIGKPFSVCSIRSTVAAMLGNRLHPNGELRLVADAGSGRPGGF